MLQVQELLLADPFADDLQHESVCLSVISLHRAQRDGIRYVAEEKGITDGQCCCGLHEQC